jgi:hypothetical protein
VEGGGWRVEGGGWRGGKRRKEEGRKEGRNEIEVWEGEVGLVRG